MGKVGRVTSTQWAGGDFDGFLGSVVIAVLYSREENSY